MRTASLEPPPNCDYCRSFRRRQAFCFGAFGKSRTPLVTCLNGSVHRVCLYLFARGFVGGVFMWVVYSYIRRLCVLVSQAVPVVSKEAVHQQLRVVSEGLAICSFSSQLCMWSCRCRLSERSVPCNSVEQSVSRVQLLSCQSEESLGLHFSLFRCSCEWRLFIQRVVQCGGYFSCQSTHVLGGR